MTREFELGRYFCTMRLHPKFHHPMFTRSEVIVLINKQTNKQTPLKTSNALRYATTLGKHHRRGYQMRVNCDFPLLHRRTSKTGGDRITVTINPFTAEPVKAFYTLPYWSNPPFLIFDIRALWRSGLSARVPECQKLKMVG